MTTTTCAVVASTTDLDVVPSDGGNTLTANTAGALLLDSITPSVNDLILLKDQTDLTQNGLFTVTQVGDMSLPFILQRWNVDSASLVEGLLVFVRLGSTHACQLFVSLDNLDEVGVSQINFEQVKP